MYDCLKNMKLQIKASFTVEMTFVFPIVLLFLLLLINLNLYLHDCTCLQAKLYDVVYQSSFQKNWTLEEIEDYVSSNMYLSKLTQIRLTKGKGRVVLTGVFECNPKGLFSSFNQAFQIRSVIHKELKEDDREEKARVYSCALALGEKVKGGKQALETIKEWVKKIR